MYSRCDCQLEFLYEYMDMDMYLVLSQYMRLTDRRTDRQNCYSNTVCSITCSHTVKIDKLNFVFMSNLKIFSVSLF